MFAKRRLQGIELVAIGQPFDCGDLFAVRLKAGPYSLPIHQDRTGATRAMFTSDVGAGEIQFFSKDVRQIEPGFHRFRVRLAVDR